MWIDLAYWTLVAIAGGLGGGLVAALAWYALLHYRNRRDSSAKWEPAHRTVGTQTWIVVQRIHHGWFGRVLLAEQLIAVLGNDAHPDEIDKRLRVAELRAAWLNNGQPRTPAI